MADSIIFCAGAVTRIGRTTDGSSQFDFEPEEVKRGSTLKTSVFDFTYDSKSFSLLDTPGSTNFIADTISALRAADTAILVAGAVSGIKVQGEKAWKIAGEQRLARAIFVNEMDKERADFDLALDTISACLDIKPVVLQLPIGAEQNFSGVIDLISMEAFTSGKDGLQVKVEIPSDMIDDAQVARQELVEAVAEVEDALLEKYLEGESISRNELVAALRRGICSGALTPVLCGSAETTGGVEALLGVCAEYFPSPLKRIPFLCETEGKIAELSASDSDFTGLVYKTFADTFAGKISLVRVVCGSLHSDETVYNPQTGAVERVGKLHIQQGKEQLAVDSVGAGQIVAIAKLKDTKTGHTLCAESNKRKLTDIEFPESCISFAVDPKSRGDEDKMFGSIQKMSIEDPSITVHRDPVTHEVLVSGMGQEHVDITLEKMKRKFNVEVVAHAPKVPYRETITASAEAQGKHKKQSGGRGQFGDCWLRIKPRGRGEGFQFKSEIFGGAIPKNYIPAVEKGVVEAMAAGFLAGFPMVDIEATVYDGSFHAVDSSDLAFKLAAAKGFRNALEKAHPVLLEPLMKAELVVPDDVTGDVIGDLNSRRGKVISMSAKGHSQIITAEVPMAEMLTYARDLRALTADRGSFHLEFQSYQEVPVHIADKVIEEVNDAAGEKKVANAG